MWKSYFTKREYPILKFKLNITSTQLIHTYIIHIFLSKNFHSMGTLYKYQLYMDPFSTVMIFKRKMTFNFNPLYFSQCQPQKTSDFH